MTAEKDNKESTDKEKITKEETAAVPTAQRDNNEISFVLKHHLPLLKSKLLPLLPRKTEYNKSTSWQRLPHTVIHRKTFSLRKVYSILTLSNTEDYRKRSSGQQIITLQEDSVEWGISRLGHG